MCLSTNYYTVSSRKLSQSYKLIQMVTKRKFIKKSFFFLSRKKQNSQPDRIFRISRKTLFHLLFCLLCFFFATVDRIFCPRPPKHRIVCHLFRDYQLVSICEVSNHTKRANSWNDNSRVWTQ